MQWCKRWKLHGTFFDIDDTTSNENNESHPLTRYALAVPKKCQWKNGFSAAHIEGKNPFFSKLQYWSWFERGERKKEVIVLLPLFKAVWNYAGTFCSNHPQLYFNPHICQSAIALTTAILLQTSFPQKVKHANIYSRCDTAPSQSQLCL